MANVHGDGGRSGADSRKSKDPRASAIAAAARRLFETIGVWDAVAGDAQPILDMVVTDFKLEHAVRPTFLTFAGEVEEGEPFAHMIENRLLVDALVEQGRAHGIDLRAGAVTGFDNGPNASRSRFGDGETISARLLVGADGARSQIREQAGIATHGWNYDQSAIVTHRRARARSQRPRRRAFPAGRAIRDPAAHGQALLDRVDRDRARGRAHRRAARR